MGGRYYSNISWIIFKYESSFSDFSLGFTYVQREKDKPENRIT